MTPASSFQLPASGLFLRSISMQIVQYVVQYQIVAVLVFGLHYFNRNKEINSISQVFERLCRYFSWLLWYESVVSDLLSVRNVRNGYSMKRVFRKSIQFFFSGPFQSWNSMVNQIINLNFDPILWFLFSLVSNSYLCFIRFGTSISCLLIEAFQSLHMT